MQLCIRRRGLNVVVFDGYLEEGASLYFAIGGGRIRLAPVFHRDGPAGALSPTIHWKHLFLG